MTRKLIARILLLAGLVLLLALFAWEAFAEELTVVEVRSNIALAEKDPVYRDFYINAGSAQGLKQHLVVTATRKVSIRDASGTQTYGEMMVPVGQLKIIYVSEKIAVGREYKLLSREDEPTIEQAGIMIGDKIELKASFVDNHKISSQKPIENAQVGTESIPARAAAVAPIKAETKVESNAEMKADMNSGLNAALKANQKTDQAAVKSEPKIAPKPEAKSTTPPEETEKTAAAEDSTI